MIRLHQFPGFGTISSASPFCTKVEVYLRLAGLPYESVPLATPMRAPKGKLPYIVDDDGAIVADSGFIVAHLERRDATALDRHLTPAERASSHALRCMIEEHLYWALAYFRWIEDAGFARLQPAYFGSLPPGVRQLVSGIARVGVRRQLHGHGMGRHSRSEVSQLGIADLDALSAHLGDRPFFLGETPTSIDATAYAFLAHILYSDSPSPLEDHLAAQSSLVAYCERMRARCGL